MTPTSSSNDAEERVNEQQIIPPAVTTAVGNDTVAQTLADQQDALIFSTSSQEDIEDWRIRYVTERPGLEEEARVFVARRIHLIAVPPEGSGRRAYSVNPFEDPPVYPELDEHIPPPPQRRVTSYRPRVGWGEPDPDVVPPPPYAEVDPNIVPLVLYLVRGYLLWGMLLSVSQYVAD